MKKESGNFKEAMIDTFQTIWKYASQAERDYIGKMWALIIKPAHVLKWNVSDRSHEYQLELREEMIGSHPDIPVGQLIIKQKMKIVFSEEKIPGTNTYRQIIQFPNKGVCFRLGIGWLSKESPLERILIEEKSQHQIVCTVEALGQKIARPAEEALAFWKKTEWNVT